MSESPPEPNGDPGASPTVVAGLAKLGLVLRHHAWQRRNSSGLTPTQGQILALLRSHAAPPTVGEIARSLGVTSATTSDALSALVDKGLTTKTRARSHPRAVAVRLTAAGRLAAEREAEWPDVLLEVIDVLEREERAALLRAMTKMIHALQERDAIPVSRMCPGCVYFRPNAHADSARPHHCAFVDAPFGDAELRLDCVDHEPLAPDEAETIWAAFAHPVPTP